MKMFRALGPAIVLVLIVAARHAHAAEATATVPMTGDAIVIDRIEVRPLTIRFSTPQQYMHVVVTGFDKVGRTRDLTSSAQVVSANDKVARFERGVVRPAGNGKTEVTVSAAGKQMVLPVEAVQQDKPEQVSFEFSTLPALTKQGCNQGACHGSPSGKGGFRLSLRAYDAVFDTETLTREGFGRRVNSFDPEASLLLKKPLMEVSHVGGKRLRRGEFTYDVLRDWIAQGCQPDPADAPRCVKLEVYPRQRELLRPDKSQQLLVLGHFSDGAVRDLTWLADYLSSDTAVATADGLGLVKSHSRGETTVLVRYLDLVDTVALTFLEPRSDFKWPKPPEHNYVDRIIFEKLARLQIPPSDLCGDDEFVRRVYLDVLGLLPNGAETEKFLTEKDPQKRAKLIDALLDRPEFAQFWASKWADLLRIRKTKMSESGTYKFQRWLEASFRDNMPYDQFARELLSARGSTLANPPANFYRAAADVNDCTETVSQLFLGVRMQCAKCHNHPFERWTQDNYYGISAFFTRVQRKKTASADDLIIWLARTGETTQPRTGKTMKPWLPMQGDADIEAEADRSDTFVDWLTGAKNPFFARMEVNRLWSQLMGRGVVEPVDDFRDSNPASHPALLEALAQELVKSGYDRRQVLRTILNSRIYQLSARTVSGNQDDVQYFSHARPRLLSAEQLLDAVCQVTGVEEKFAGVPPGTHATQLPNPDLDHEFLKVFGKPARESPCACERSTDSNLSQALQMINGPLVHAKLRDERNRFRKMLAAGEPPANIVKQLYLAAFCRQPTESELKRAMEYIAAAEKPERGVEDLCWAVLNANEFLFQH